MARSLSSANVNKVFKKLYIADLSANFGMGYSVGGLKEIGMFKLFSR